MALPTILQALADPLLLGAACPERGPWRTWDVFNAAVYALPMNAEQTALYRECTHRSAPPASPPREVWAIIGRRGGKSANAARLAVHIAALTPHPYLAAGERGIVAVLATDRAQAGIILGYTRAAFEASPLLERMVRRYTRESIELHNGCAIEVTTASFRTSRGRTLLAVIADEVAFWRDEETGANPAAEVFRALRPGLATTRGPLIAVTTPFAKAGPAYDAYQRHFGQDSDVLVWAAATHVMNPTLDRAVIEAAYRDDPAAAESEFGAAFRADIGSFLDHEQIAAAVNPSRPSELPPRPNTLYHSYDDASGGRHDAFTFAIAHAEGSRLVLDVVRHRRPPFDPGEVVREYAALARQYGCSIVRGDRYAAEWCAAAYREAGIVREASALTASDTFLETLPLFAQGRVELPEDRTLLAELRALIRRVRTGARDLVSHPPRGHDDLANAACGALVAAAQQGVAECLDDARVVGESAVEEFTSPFRGVDHDAAWAESPWSDN